MHQQPITYYHAPIRQSQPVQGDQRFFGPFFPFFPFLTGLAVAPLFYAAFRPPFWYAPYPYYPYPPPYGCRPPYGCPPIYR